MKLEYVKDNNVKYIEEDSNLIPRLEELGWVLKVEKKLEEEKKPKVEKTSKRGKKVEDK